MPKRIFNAYNIAKEVIRESIEDNILKLSAALAYYTIFAIPPMLLMIIGLLSIFYGREAIEGSIFSDLRSIVGSDVAIQIQETLRKTSLQGKNFFATAVGITALLLAATGIFGEVQDSINTIWGLKVNPKKSWVKLLMNRLISFSIIIVLGFVLLVSLLVNAMVKLFIERLKLHLTEDFLSSLVVLDYCILLVVTTILFGFIFKVLPDAKIKWKDVLVGSVFTALLFMGGKELISFYLDGNVNISAYGGASSIIVLLLWVYFSSMILYVGAEFTQVWVRFKGRRIQPNRYALWVEHDYVVMPSNQAIGHVKVMDEKGLKKEIAILKEEKMKLKEQRLQSTEKKRAVELGKSDADNTESD